MPDVPVISVIVPCYKAADTLERCVSSLTTQTFRDIEIILVNDCSPDTTGELCEELKATDPRIKVIHLEANSGPSAARNAGLSVACGTWITFVDSDDWTEPETYETALNYAEKHSACHVLWSYVSEYGENRKEKHIYSHDKIFTNSQSEQLLVDILGPTNGRLSHPEHIHSLSTVWNKLFRLDIIKKKQLKFYDMDIIGPEDLFFSAQYINCTAENTSVYINKCFYHYIKSDGSSVSTKYNPIYTKTITVSNEELKKLVKGRSNEEECLSALKNRKALSLINIGLNEISSIDGWPNITSRLRKVLCDNDFHSAFKQLDLSKLPLKWKIFFLCARLKLTLPIYILLRIMNVLIKKKD